MKDPLFLIIDTLFESCEQLRVDLTGIARGIFDIVSDPFDKAVINQIVVFGHFVVKLMHRFKKHFGTVRVIGIECMGDFPEFGFFTGIDLVAVSEDEEGQKLGAKRQRIAVVKEHFAEHVDEFVFERRGHRAPLIVLYRRSGDRVFRVAGRLRRNRTRFPGHYNGRSWQ